MVWPEQLKKWSGPSELGRTVGGAGLGGKVSLALDMSRCCLEMWTGQLGSVSLGHMGCLFGSHGQGGRWREEVGTLSTRRDEDPEGTVPFQL